jgi:hypothetical protein
MSQRDWLEAGPATVQDAALRLLLWSRDRVLALEPRSPLAVAFPKRPEKERGRHLVRGLGLARDRHPG